MRTMTCRVCDVIVAEGEFCGNCGATASPRRGDGPPWLRLSAYAPAPGEHVLRPSVTSTIFPALPRRSRTTFGVALLGLTALLVGTALPLWQASLIGLVGFALPVIFVAYLLESGAVADLSVGTLVAAAGLGIAFGIGWSLATDAAAARVDDDALGLPASTLKILITCLAIPLGFLILLLAPTILLRIWRPGVRESLSGLIVGAFAAVCFVSAGSLTALAPELAGGPVDTDAQSPTHLVIGGLIQGLAVPLTAAAVGGAVGATLWFVPRTAAGRRHALTAPIPAIAFGLLAYLGLGLLDFFALSNDAETAIYALLAVVALYGLRLIGQATLMASASEDQPSDAVVLCPECDHVVPDLAFCPRCGIAGHATSRASRAQRRSHRPVPTSS